MKVVVAGGSGLIGSRLVHELAAKGDEVVILSRSATASAGGARTVTWTPGAAGPWAAELRGADAVINLCGESVGIGRWTKKRKRVLRESRVVATRSLVEAVAELEPAERPSVVVNASGADVYEGLDTEPATEDTVPASTFLAELCLEWEAEASRAADLGVRVVCPRLSLVIAPGAPSLARMVLPFRFMLGGPLGSGEQWLSWIAVEDVVGLMVWALTEQQVSGPVNAAAPEPIRQRQMAEALGQVLHRPARLRTPAFAIRLALGEQATLALGSRRVVPTKAIELGYEFRVTDIEQALAAVL